MKEKTIHQDDINYVIKRYKDRIAEHGLSADSLKSGSAEKQMIRHAIHLSSLRSENPSVLDIGCGMGDFYVFLHDQKVNAKYTGYDIVEEYIEYCRGKFLQSHFELRNILDESIDGEYDNIVLSQVLNNKYSHSDNFEVMKKTIQLTFDHCKVGVSIDMMSEYVDFKSDELYYYSPEKIFAFAKTLTKRVILRHDYRPFEFCIQLFRPDAPGFVS